MTTTRMRNLAEVLRDEMVMRDKILALLVDGPKTIPELVEVLKVPSWEVTTWVMAMRRYGHLKELPKGRADDYFQYTKVDPEPNEETS